MNTWTAEDFRHQMDVAIQWLVDGLPPAAAAAIVNTRWLYAGLPTAADRHGFPPDATLLGLYVAPRAYSRAELLSPLLPPPAVTLFADNILALAIPVRDVVAHEAGHRLGYGHDAPAVIPCGSERGALARVVRAVASLPHDVMIACGSG